MAEFSKTIKSKYNFKTYEGTKEAVEWILLSLKKANLSSQKPKVDFMFDIDDIGCSCEGIKEFTENAYGQKGYKLTEFKVVQFTNASICAYIASRYCDELYINTNNKNSLEKIILCLNETTLEDANINVERDSTTKQWIVAIIQNLLANWIWIVLVAIFTSIVALFSKK